MEQAWPPAAASNGGLRRVSSASWRRRRARSQGETSLNLETELRRNEFEPLIEHGSMHRLTNLFANLAMAFTDINCCRTG
jgi:hypothetical protein